jgi:hypothetical protein
MESVTIEFDDATLKVEKDRILDNMSEEDVYWCYGADITLSDSVKELYIEAPLFYFTEKLLELSSITTSKKYTIPDHYDSYRLQVNYKNAEVIIFDEYGGGEVKLVLKRFFKLYEKAFQEAVGKLLENNHALNECNSFMIVFRQLDERLKSFC